MKFQLSDWVQIRLGQGEPERLVKLRLLSITWVQHLRLPIRRKGPNHQGRPASWPLAGLVACRPRHAAGQDAPGARSGTRNSAQLQR